MVLLCTLYVLLIYNLCTLSVFDDSSMNILFLCTSNIHRSKSAEDYFNVKYPEYTLKSAGLSEKNCNKFGSTLCTLSLLEWSDRVCVMEPMHVERISMYAGDHYLKKVVMLNIEDIYQYMQPELIAILELNENLIFM